LQLAKALTTCALITGGASHKYLGNTEEVTIGALAERVGTLVAGSSSPIMSVPYDVAYESGFEDMPRRVADLTKARNVIGYEPTLGLDNILVEIIEHFKRK
jgi:UDP-glucose 4-epimerase